MCDQRAYSHHFIIATVKRGIIGIQIIKEKIKPPPVQRL